METVKISPEFEISEQKGSCYMKYINIMGLIVLCLLISNICRVYARENNPHINVGVYVRGEENLNGIIENYISKELTSLGSIIVTHSQLDCAIDIVIKKLKKGTGNTKNSCAVSVTIIDRFDSLPITRAVEGLDAIIRKIKTNPDVIKQLEGLSKELVGLAISTTKIKSYQNSFLYTGSAGQLGELCSRIVNDFNNEYLKDKRKIIRRKYY